MMKRKENISPSPAYNLSQIEPESTLVYQLQGRGESPKPILATRTNSIMLCALRDSSTFSVLCKATLVMNAPISVNKIQDNCFTEYILQKGS